MLASMVESAVPMEKSKAGKPPSRQSHSCPTCLRIFSRREYAVRHQKRKHPEAVLLPEPAPCSGSPVVPSASASLSLPPPPPPPRSPPPPPLLLSVPILRAVRPPNIQGRLPTYRTDSSGSDSSLELDDEPRLVELDQDKVERAPPTLPALVASGHKRRYNDGPGLTVALEPYDHPHHSPSSSSSSWHLPLTPPDDSAGPLENLTAYGFFPHSVPGVDLRLLVDSCNIGADPGHFVADARLEAADPKSGRFVVFNVRVTVSLGTTLDWEAADGAEGTAVARRSTSHSQIAQTRLSQFFPTTQRFCIGLRRTEDIPPLPRLSRWASLAMNFLVPSIPVVHRGTMFQHDEGMLSPLAFALAVGGAGFERTGHFFHEDMCKSKRQFAISHLGDLDFSFEEQVSAFQAFIIYNACSLHLRSPEDEALSTKAHATLVMAFKSANFPAAIREGGWCVPSPRVELDPTALYAEWLVWVQLETIKRITVFTLLLDLSMSNDHNNPALIDLTTIDIDFPASDTLWNAETPTLWMMQLRTDNTRPLAFLAALDALLTLDFPSPDSPHSVTLARLPALASASLSLLTQSLYRMQREVQRVARAPLVPGRAIKGLPSSVAWDTPELALRKIDNGLRLLAVSGGPGTQVPWFRRVQPVFL